jgi:hypothetical protein
MTICVGETRFVLDSGEKLGDGILPFVRKTRLYVKLELRAMTNSQRMPESAVIIVVGVGCHGGASLSGRTGT